MNYEYRILLAEKELAHLREMQAIMQSHQDTHDQGFVAVASRLDRIEENLDRLVAAQLVTEQKLQGLIDILTREHSNGHKGERAK